MGDIAPNVHIGDKIQSPDKPVSKANLWRSLYSLYILVWFSSSIL